MTHPSIYIRGTCRACRAPLQEVLSLGDLRLNAFPTTPWELEQVHRVPLTLMACQGCGLVQLDRTVPRDWMYRHYWYRSSVNETMVDELGEIVAGALEVVGDIGFEDAVLDIGANDGTLLAGYRTHGRNPRKFAIEPAFNLQDRLQQHCDVRICDYFPTEGLTGKTFQIITAIAVCYDTDDPLKFMRALADHLAPGGVAVLQFQDFGQQLESAAFDNVCHEHLEYYTLWSLSHLFKQTGLMVQRVEHSAINGGSLRLYLRRAEDQIPAEASVHQQLLREAQQGLDTPGIRGGNFQAFEMFHRRVMRVRAQIESILESVQEQGKILDILGASTKGNILLQVLGVGPTQARQAIDRDQSKWGALTTTGIPIVGEEVGRRDPADVWLCPIWQFRESVVRREAEYLEKGGTMIFPLPQCEVVTRG